MSDIVFKKKEWRGLGSVDEDGRGKENKCANKQDGKRRRVMAGDRDRQ